jgi:predicted permease
VSGVDRASETRERRADGASETRERRADRASETRERRAEGASETRDPHRGRTSSEPDTPPAFALLLLRLVLPRRHREFVIGDLIEEFEQRVERASAEESDARWWFWSQTCGSLAALMFRRHSPRGIGPAHLKRESLLVRRSSVDILRQNLSYALRGMRRSPGFTAMVVSTLALGVGANAAVYSVLSGIFGLPAGLQDPETLRRLYLAPPPSASPDTPPTASDQFSYPSFATMDEAVGKSGAMAAFSESSEATATWNGANSSAQVTWVSDDYFSVLGVEPSRGRLFAPEEGAIAIPTRVAVLTHDFWTAAFGADPDVVGGSVAIDDTTYTVIGVASAGFQGLDLGRTDVFLPLSVAPFSGQPAIGLAWYQWGSSHLGVVARLGTRDAEARLMEQATVGYRGQPPIRGYLIDENDVVLAGPIVEARGPGQLEGAIPISIRAAGVSAMVLLIACANVASLLLVRAMRRRREFAVRRALGVSRGRLFGQLLTESFLLALVAGGAACFVGVWGGSQLRSLLFPDVHWARPILESRSVALVLLIATIGGLLAGVAPALFGSDASSALKTRSSGGGARWLGVRTAMLVAQGSLSMVLVVGAALFVRSLGQLDALDLGYETDRLIRASTTVRGAAARAGAPAIREAAQVMAVLPGVEGVALSSSLPMGGNSSTALFVDLETRITEPSPIYLSVTPGFFEVAGMELLEGRTFEPDEAAVAVVNESLARRLSPSGHAIGTCIFLGEPTAECTRVVGVAEDARRGRIVEEQELMFFTPLEEGRETAILARFTGDWTPVAASLRSQLERTFDPTVVRVERMSDALAPQLRPWRLGAQLFGAFGLLALLVTAVGVYSVIAYSVSQRTQEMGVRIALGARLENVLGLVMRDALGVIGLGIVFGVAAALAMGKLVAALLYGLSPRDPVAMSAAAAVLLVVGIVGSLIPALRATRVDPVKALASE